RSDEIVLLSGETGTGKSYLARKIHEDSRRKDRPFVEVALTSDIGSENLTLSSLFGHERGAFTGAVDERRGLFSLADGGTIFLDEIGDATPATQEKLLRVLDTSTFKRLGSVHDVRVDVRVIAATNRDLARMVEDGTFRSDLYHRLKVIAFELPPLRDRRADIPVLAEYLLERSQERNGSGGTKVLAPALAEKLRNYSWPGNIRELEHSIRYALAMSETDLITEADFPDEVRAALESTVDPAPSASAAAPRTMEGGIVDSEALRRIVRQTNALDAEGTAAHVDFAKRTTWLKILIEECGGDIPLIARYWDRSSEKTVRNLIHTYGLAEVLDRARKNRNG
ncbi:MAG: sigma 54-interacting transcriptional regulator, partial [Planctomycetota bacterium]